MSRGPRLILRVVAILVVLVGIAFLGMQWYLRSDDARDRATEQLSELFGSRVTVQRLDAGFGSTSVDIVIPAATHETSGETPAAEPVLVGTLRANVGPVGLAAGRTPDQVSINNARLNLQFDANGDLLTQLPNPPADGGTPTIPAISVHGATVVIDQAGRPPFEVSGIELTITPQADRLVLSGGANDPKWQQWKLTGDFAADGTAGSVDFAPVDAISLTMPMLESIPFVPKETWEEFRAEGNTTAQLHLSKSGDDLAYRIELRPTDAQITVPSADLVLSHTTGTVTIADAKVTLEKFTGTTADGRLTTDAILDFAATPSELHFDLVADGLAVQKLPASWKLPAKLDGKLNGTADLTLVLAEDGVKTRGSGKGTVANAKWNNIPIELLELKLVSEEQGYKFQTEQPASFQLPEQWLRAALLTAILLQPPEAKEKPKSDDEPTYFEANLRLRDVDLGDLIQKANLDIPIAIDGKISVQVKAAIPVDQPGELKAYRIDGTVTLPELRLEGLALTDVAATAKLRDGVLTLTEISGSVPPPTGSKMVGRFEGSATYGIDPPTELTAKLAVTSLPIGEVLKVAPDLRNLVSGPVTGSVELSIPSEKLDDLTAVVANADLTAEGLTVLDRSVSGLSLKLAVRDGTARLTEAKAAIEGLPLTGSATLGLTKPYPYKATVSAAEADVVSLQKLVPEVQLLFPIRGKITTEATATGTASPLTVAASGSATAEDLTLDNANIGRLQFNWTVSENQVAIRDLSAKLLGGTVTVAATVPFAADKAGTFTVDFKDINLEVKNLDAPIIGKIPEVPVRLEGSMSGTARGTIPARGKDPADRVTVALELTGDKIRVQGIPTERLRANIGIKSDQITYTLTGDALGGNFDIDGTYPFTQDKKPAVPPKEDGSRGKINLSNIDLSRLAEALKLQYLRPLRGIINFTADYRFDPGTSAPSGSGTLRVNSLGWGDEIGSDIVARLRFTNDAIEITETSGRFAGGELRVRARYNLANPNRSFFNLSLDRVEAERILKPFGVSGLDGNLSLTMRGTIGREFRGTGTLAATRMSAGDVRMSEVRIPFTWAFSTTGRGELTISEAYGAVSGGRIRGQTTVRWSDTVTVDGDLRFIDLDVGALLGRIGRGGRANGRFVFAGRNVESVNDLTGTLTGKFGGGSGSLFDLPLFRAMSPFLGGSSSFTQAREGEIRARLARGIFRVERFTLDSQNATLFAEGTVGLNGRLDLDVVYQTGQIGPTPLLARLIRLIPVAGPIPLGVLLDLNKFLSNRIVRLDVTGTIDRPVVRVNTARLVSENALRYLLSNYLPTFIPEPTLRR